MLYKIGVLKGDGIGPEIVDEAIKVIHAVAKKYNLEFEFQEELIGGASLKVNDVPITDETIERLRKTKAILMGAVGDPIYDQYPPELRPEKALLKLRKALGLYANLRPARLYKDLIHHSPLKPSQFNDTLDIAMVRELNGGIYFGEQFENEEKTYAWDQMAYSEFEVARIAHVAFKMAEQRKGKVTSVDKANVLASSRLWRRTVEKISKSYPTVKLEHLYVDNAAMQLILNPTQFDVVLTSNLFGDILSDEMSVLTGSIGLLPSASLNNEKLGLYEPIHGSAPTIANQNIANPLATILSAAMMFRYSFDREDIARDIEKAVEKVISEGYRTVDITSGNVTPVGTREMGDLVAEAL